MTDFSQALQQGAQHAWPFIPSAILLGALHGLEPGHSKTMMAAFIIAIRGTIFQAVLLGLSAAISHSLIIWLLAALALKYGGQWNAETTEPYFQLASAAIIICIAAWMLWRTRRDVLAEEAHAREHAEGRAHSHHHAHDYDHGDGHHHHHHHGHDHAGHDDARVIRTDHGVVRLSVFETDVPPVFRLEFMERGKGFVPEPATVKVETIRPGGERQVFAFAQQGQLLESTTTIPEPHAFELSLQIAHNGHAHTYREHFSEAGHDHGHLHDDLPDGADFQDAHEAAHAADIAKRFENRRVSTGQIVLFGLTGGLLPCPAAFTVLLVCLQVKQFALGFALVAAFSFGLAITMVTVGAIAAWSVGHAQKRLKGFGGLMRRAPYLSCALLIVLASYMAWQGWSALARH